MSAEVGKSSWVIGAVTGFLFVVGAATSTLGFMKSIEDRAAASTTRVTGNVAPVPTPAPVQPQPALAPVAQPAPAAQPVAEAPEAEPAAAAERSEEASFREPARPSFDCDRASTGAEHMICASPQLARLDRRMARIYRYGQREQLLSDQTIAEQLIWLQLREICPNEECLRVAYEERIATLRSEVGNS